jgi:hypothetical protein
MSSFRVTMKANGHRIFIWCTYDRINLYYLSQKESKYKSLTDPFLKNFIDAARISKTSFSSVKHPRSHYVLPFVRSCITYAPILKAMIVLINYLKQRNQKVFLCDLRFIVYFFFVPVISRRRSAILY